MTTRSVVVGPLALAALLGAGCGRAPTPEEIVRIQSAVNSTVVVTVVDTAGTPKPNQVVGWEDTAGNEGGWLPTNASGVVQLSPPSGAYFFKTEIGGTEFVSGPSGHCVTPGCTAATVLFSRPVDVLVADTGGAPLSGKTVKWQRASDEYLGGNATTDASGHASVYPPMEPARFQVTVDGTTFYSGSAGHCTQPSCPTTATILVSQQTVVTVVDGNNQPISGRAVTPLSDEGITSSNKTTNTSGQATFRLPFAHWRFRATCSGTTEQFFSGNAGHCFIPGGCLTAKITMPCGQCTGKANGTACNDQNACTGSSTCQSQKCTGGSPMSCPASDQCHDAGACGAQTGTCSNPAKANGASCSDGNGCTRTDTCQAGVCTGANPVVCAAGDQCHDAGVCNSATGLCSNPAKANGTPCNDGNACTQGDVCTAGTCQGPTSFTCSAPDTCHDAGTCTSGSPLAGPPSTQNLLGWWKLDGDGTDATGGGHDLTNEGAVPVPGRSGMAMGFDGTSCMTLPIWDEARMQGGSGLTIMAWINPDVYECAEPYEMNTVLGRGWDYSIGAWCYPNVPPGYGQGLAAAVRNVDPPGWGYGGGWGSGTGWHHVAFTWDHQTGTTFLDTKVIGTMPFPGDITDWDPLFTVGCMTSWYWSQFDRIRNFHGAIDEVMLYDRALSAAEIESYYKASDPCTHPVHADGSTCTDGNACTQGDTCQSGTCGGSPVTCVAQDQCHIAGTCNIYTGCSNPSAPDGTECNDGDTCTQSETCQAAACRPPAVPYPVIVNLPVEDLGHLPGGSAATAYDINASGEIVGTEIVGSEERGWRRPAGGPMADVTALTGLATPTWPLAINNAGTAAGLSGSLEAMHAFRYSASGALDDFGTIGESVGDADVNAAGQVAGWFTLAGKAHGYRYTDGIGFEDVGSLNGETTAIDAINDAGTVFGSSAVGGRLHLVRFDNAVIGLEDLSAGFDPTLGWDQTWAVDAAGDYVVGNAYRAGGYQPIRLHDGVAEAIPSSFGWWTFGMGVNAAGDVVGYGYHDAQLRRADGFIYTDQLGFKKLNDLIDPASGWDLQFAVAINDSREIVGRGIHNGQPAAFRLSLSPQQIACGSPNQCGGNSGDICLWTEGVVDTGDGHFVAVFGYQNGSSNAVRPTTNEIRINGDLVANPQPWPPAWLAPGSHPAGFTPRFDPGQTIAWTVDGKTVTASAASSGPNAARRLARVPIGASGFGVMIEGQLVTIRADMAKYTSPPSEPPVAPEPSVGDEFKGKLVGNLNVGPTGAATYTVPIAIPPGIAGMAPNLSLAYNSQGGNGIAGQGWELSGLSMIHRCPKTRQADGKARPIALNALEMTDEDDIDGICLDGQRLFETAPGSGTYFNERADFNRITRVADGSFKVETKSGETRFYGSSTGPGTGRIDVAGAANAIQTAIWALDKVTDAWGNYFIVVYNNDVQQTGLRVVRIDYTGHIEQGSGQVTPPFRSVSFDYEPRPDVRTSRIGPALFVKNRRLTKIRTRDREYRLTYNDPNEHIPSQLGSIEYCDTSQSPARCLEPLTFGWFEAASNAFPPSMSYALPPFVPDTQLVGSQFVDLDGDGLPEFVRAREQVLAGACAGSAPVPCTPNSVLDPITHNRKATPQEFFTLHNTGTGWDSWGGATHLPISLSDKDGLATGTRFADVDGDGVSDVVRDHADLHRDAGGNYYYCPFQPNTTCGGSVEHFSPAIWLNRIPYGGTWEFQEQLARTFPGDLGNPEGGGQLFFVPPWGTSGEGHRDQVADMDGDGRADIVRMADAGGGYGMVDILLSKPGGWARVERATIQPMSLTTINSFLRDQNGDGLPDLVTEYYVQYADQHIESNLGVAINRGVQLVAGSNPSRYTITFDPPVGRNASPGGTGLPLAHQPALGDLDGDGYHDAVALAPTSAPGHYFENPNTHTGVRVGIGFSDTLGILFSDARGLPYRSILSAYAPQGDDANSDGVAVPNDFNLALIDLNGDGLADLVRNHRDYGGEIFLNTGTTWREMGGNTTWRTLPGVNPLPVVPGLVDLGFDRTGDGVKDEKGNGAVFVDLDGDGLLDVIQEGRGANASRAWLNVGQPPVITRFPAPLDASRWVTYAVTTEATPAGSTPVYVDSKVLGSGTRFSPAPMRVVAAVQTDDGIGGQSNTTYQYSDLRASTLGYGPQGFKTMTVNEPDGSSTTTTFAQAFPYTGQVTLVERRNQGKVSTTETKYCTQNPSFGHPDPCLDTPEAPTTYAPRQALFVHPVEVTDTTYVRSSSFPEETSSKTIKTITRFLYDAAGNSRITQVEVTGFGATRTTTTVNWYGTQGSEEERLGKATQTTVVTGARSHTTTFKYRTVFGALALDKKMLEPFDSDEAAKSATAYDYDKFGNVITSTICAGDADNPLDFDACTAGAAGPAALPYRTTTISYDPANLAGGAAAVGYGIGRFPVKTTVWTKDTELDGHVELVRFDPLLGLPLEKTGPNGIKTCYAYDSFGQQTKQIGRCGSDHELETTTKRFRPVRPPCESESCPDFADLVHLITVTRPPTGSPSWVSSDVLGRTIKVQTLGFGGDIATTLTEFDSLGRVHRSSAPFLTTEAPAWTTLDYDPLGRQRLLSQEVGPLGDPDTGAAANSSLTVTTTYQPQNPALPEGASILTSRIINGETRATYETKNAAGKVIAAANALGQVVSYQYDDDGNLTDTFDPAGNNIHLGYDVRGRKITSSDPDLGLWSYGYDGFGDLRTQKDAKNATTAMTYDRMGRLLTKTDGTTGDSAEWVYDVAPGAGKGKLAAMVSAPDERLRGSGCAVPVPLTTSSSGNRAARWFAYSAFGELLEETQCTDSETFVTSYHYDDFGRQDVVTYPAVHDARLTIGYRYTDRGFLHYLSDVDSGDVLWAASEIDAAGRVTSEYTRNGVDTISLRNPSSGWLLRRTSTAWADGGKVIQRFGYRYDEGGNLRQRLRRDDVSGDQSSETFEYDALDRLIRAHTTAPSDYLESYDYDVLGNLWHKQGATYGYDRSCPAGSRSAGPHAVCSVGGGASYTYDANGNMTAGNGHSVSYTPFNKPRRIASTEGGPAASVDFVYGADDQRVLQIASPDGGTTEARTLYVGLGATGKSIYERTTTTSPSTSQPVVEHAHFIYAGGVHGGNAFALRLVKEDASTSSAVTSTKYFNFDHLGSVTGVSDETGHVTPAGSSEQNPGILSYDAWGARRASEHQAASPSSFVLPPGHREFTAHESIPGLTLVNMNGRVYDPSLGRFLSPDPTVQFATDLQSFNRYSYVHNNPLSYNDPTGYVPKFLTAGYYDPTTQGGFLHLTTLISCSAGPVGCTFASAFSAMASVMSAAVNGEGVDKVLLSVAINAGVGWATGGLAGNDPISRFVQGYVSTATSTILYNAATGQELGTNLLNNIGADAFEAAVTMTAQGPVRTTEASAAQAQGDGGSGESVIEAREREGAAGAAIKRGSIATTQYMAMANLMERDKYYRGIGRDGSGRTVAKQTKVGFGVQAEKGGFFVGITFDDDGNFGVVASVNAIGGDKVQITLGEHDPNPAAKVETGVKPKVEAGIDIGPYQYRTGLSANPAGDKLNFGFGIGAGVEAGVEATWNATKAVKAVTDSIADTFGRWLVEGYTRDLPTHWK